MNSVHWSFLTEKKKEITNYIQTGIQILYNSN